MRNPTIFLGDNEGDWACDCKPTYIFHPQTSKCYQVYSKGPCRQNEILVLQKRKLIPICEQNNCEDGKFRFNNICTRLESHDGCKQPNKDSKSQKLYLNATSLQLYCSFNIPPRFTDEDSEYHDERDCPPSGKRSQQGLCQ